MHQPNAERAEKGGGRRSPPRRFVLLTLALVLSPFVLLEIGLTLLLEYPPRSAWLVERLREYYVAEDRRIIHYDPECARYDESVSYTLRPGACTFSNREFSVEVRVNRAGLRDSEAALAAPEIVVLGDSHAMGWGVEQDETFAHLVGQRSGRRVLNAAVSSYGTVRQLRMLERLDRESLEWVVIQYAPNDSRENRTYARTGRLKIMSRRDYDRLVERNRDRVAYFPGKHLLRLFPLLVKGAKAKADVRSLRDVDGEARTLLKVIRESGSVPEQARLVVLEIDKLGRNDPGFAEALRREAAREDNRDLGGRMTVLDLSAELTPDVYLVYDGHMAPAGHRVVADRLCEVIGCEGEPP